MFFPQESSEKFLPTTRVDLLKSENILMTPVIEVPGQQLGASLWPELTKKTQVDKRERAAIISTNKGKLITSKIFQGTIESGSSVTSPLLPHGIKSLLPWVKGLVFIHSHPKPEELSHIKTTLFSDGDIRSFYNSTFKALVMVDPGGVHVLLLKSSLIDEGSLLPTFNLHNAALAEARKGDNTVLKAMSELSKLIAPYGLKYYYTPKLSPNEEGQIVLRDVQTLE